MIMNIPGLGDIDITGNTARSATVDRNGIVIEVDDILLNVKRVSSTGFIEYILLVKGI